MAALVACSGAWVIYAAFLSLDLLGRLPFKRRRSARPSRLQSTAGLAMMTGLLVTQVGELSSWPLTARIALHVTDMTLVLAFLICTLIAADTRHRRITGQTPQASENGD